MNTNHTHRFDLDTAICDRCGATHEEVRAAREAAAAESAADTRTAARRDMDAVAKENDRRDRAANRRSYYERTGR